MNARNPLPLLFAAALGALIVLGGQAIAAGQQEITATQGAGTTPRAAWGAQPGTRLADLLGALELDAEQHAALLALRDSMAAQRQVGIQRLSTGEILSRVLDAEEPDRQALHTEMDHQLTARGAALHAQLDAFLDFRATLRPEQLALLRTRVTTWRERMWDESTQNRCWWWMDGQ